MKFLIMPNITSDKLKKVVDLSHFKIHCDQEIATLINKHNTSLRTFISQGSLPKLSVVTIIGHCTHHGQTT